MPMLDVTIPEDALEPEAEHALLARLTDLVIEIEGFDPSNPQVRAASRVFLHRPAEVFVGGTPEDAPHYRIVASVPEGQLDDEGRASLVAGTTKAVVDAENGAHPGDPRHRVWVFPTDVPDGTWGASGRIARHADIVARLGNAPER
jgi:phenylpyruvate tautomerase PptA (4-oxalocrotonate tautomerase family)